MADLENQTLLRGRHRVEGSIQDVGVTLYPCCAKNPCDRYNLGVRIVNEILAQDPSLRPLRYANIVNRYGTGWAWFSSLLFVSQLAALVVIGILTWVAVGSHLLGFVAGGGALLIAAYNAWMFVIMFQNWLTRWEDTNCMIAIPRDPSPSSHNAIIRVTVQEVRSFDFLHSTQVQAIVGSITASGRASLNFNFYSPNFKWYFFTCPIYTVLALTVVFGLLAGSGIYYGISGFF